MKKLQATCSVFILDFNQEIKREHPANIYLLKVINRNTRKKERNMFKVNNRNTRTTSCRSGVLVFLLLTLNIFHTFFWCFYCCLGTGKCLLSL